MAEIETKIVDAVLHSGSWGWVVVIVIAEFRELMKSVLFSKRRKEDEEIRDMMKCRFSETDLHNMREAAYKIKSRDRN